MEQLYTEPSTILEENMDFSLHKHHKERVEYHMKMLNYYLKEEYNDRLGN
jgi:hypothetical protein